MVLKDITFSLRIGDKIAIVGKNGSGKTVLFKLIAGYLKPTTGSIYVMNKKIGDYLYTANAQFESVTAWEIIEVTEKQYHCKEVKSDEFRYFLKNDTYH